MYTASFAIAINSSLHTRCCFLQACRHVLEQSAKDLEQINIYDVYEDICLPYVYQELQQMAKVASDHPAVLGAHLTAAGAILI